MVKQKLLVSFSGGRTSGYMTKHILDKYSDQYDVKVVFANTGAEDERTLEFVNNCDKYFGFDTVWVEAVVDFRKNKGTKHKIVTFETASRNGEPFVDVCEKYGTPNVKMRSCTREMKLQAITSYMRSIGWKKGEYLTAIGIRLDETRRVSDSAEARYIVYPLVDWMPSDKQDVNDWWEDQEFNLTIPNDAFGNCLFCFQKSFKKLVHVYKHNPAAFNLPLLLDEKHKNRAIAGGKSEHEVFMFRGNISTKQFIEMADNSEDLYGMQVRQDSDNDKESGCSESCEMWKTEG